MKRTEYFTSSQYYTGEAVNAIEDLTKKRDAFLQQNSSEIEDIDCENVKIYYTETRSRLFGILSLTYFEKEIK